MNLIEEMNPFYRSVTLYEKKKNVASTIAGMKRKYVTFKELQSEMELEDYEMEDMISDMKRKNRHSNKYIFTEIDGEPAVGVTALKRKGRKQNLGDPLSDTEQNAGDDQSDHPGKGKKKVAVSQGDLIVGKRRSHKKKMGKTAKLVNDYTNKHESIDPNRHFELKRNFQRGGWNALMREDNFPEDWKSRSADEVIREMATVITESVNEDKTRYMDMIRKKRPKVMGGATVTKEFKDKDGKSVPKGRYIFMIADSSMGGKIHLLVTKDEKESYAFEPKEFQSHFKAGHITR